MSQWVDFGALKRSVGMEQVLAGYRVELKRVGSHYLRGRCPLPTHGSERSGESFGVDLVKNVWACHSASCCQARQGRVGGTILDLVAYLEACSLREAALRLQARCGGRTETGIPNQLVSKGRSVGRSPGELSRLSFSLRLSGWHPYLEQRGMDRQTAAWFGIGYYAGRGWLHGRIVFPIHSERGELVGYAGRTVDGSEPRYLFPPGFRKSQVVYNLHRAQSCAVERVIVVEGFFDCLKVHQAGFANVVALMGTSLSEVQSKLLEERFPELVLMLDGDAAGQRASRALAARWQGRAVAVYLAGVPAGRQPDQLSSGEIGGILRGAASCAPVV